MKKNSCILAWFTLVFLCAVPEVFSQDDSGEKAREAKELMEEAQEALAKEDMSVAEALYRKAIAKDPSNAKARYNLGNLYYNNEISAGALGRHNEAAEVARQKALKHKSYHNIGNSFMQQKKYKSAVEAYKNALRNDPSDEETRYNLALAKELLDKEKKGGGDQNKDQKKDQQDKKQDKKKQEDNKGDQDQDDQGDPKKNEEGGDKENTDKKDGEEKKDKEGKPNDDGNPKNRGKQNQQEQPRRPKSGSGKLSPQQIKNLLEAMGNEERKVQEKINASKMKGPKTKTAKDW